MSKKRFIVWIGDATHYIAVEGDDFDDAVHEATVWVTGMDWGPDCSGVTVRINELGENGNIRYWNTVYIRVFPKPDLRRELDEVMSRWKAIAASDTSDFSLLMGLTDYLDAVDLDEENKDIERDYEAKAGAQKTEGGSTDPQHYVGERRVFEVEDLNHYRLCVANDMAQAITLCKSDEDRVRCRALPWDEEMPELHACFNKAWDCALNLPCGVFYSKGL